MTQSKAKNVDSYIAAAPEAARPILRQLRRIITTAVPEAEETISYGTPFYRYHGRLAYFAAHKDQLRSRPAPCRRIPAHWQVAWFCPLRHGACGYSWQCWLRRVLGSGDAQMQTAARSAWRQVIEVTVVDRVSG